RESVEDHIEIAEHQAKECAPHEISEAREGDQGDGQVEEISRQAFSLSALFQYAAVQQFIQVLALARRIEHAIKRIQPDRRLEFHFAYDRLHPVCNIRQVHLSVVETDRS